MRELAPRGRRESGGKNHLAVEPFMYVSKLDHLMFAVFAISSSTFLSSVVVVVTMVAAAVDLDTLAVRSPDRTCPIK